jgi:Pentapeptide repeats (8 copies)
MANEEHLELIKQGVDAWNKWRKEHADTRPDLSGADLSMADLHYADLYQADLSEASLSGAHLTNARLVETDFSGANLTDCSISGVSAWGLKLEGATQLNLVITPENEAAITVDNLEIAQFIYLLLNNQKIRQVIDTITSKVVLILGRFTEERKRMLDAIREELRKHDYIPVLFDFDKPATKDLHETITTLARMSRFVVADITDAKSIPQELVSIVEQLPSLPVQPILQKDCEPWATYDHIKRYPWVLELYRYAALDELYHVFVKE